MKNTNLKPWQLFVIAAIFMCAGPIFGKGLGALFSIIGFTFLLISISRAITDRMGKKTKS